MNGPFETRCAHCGRVAAEVICSLCKTDRPEYVTVKEFFTKLFNDTEQRENAQQRVEDRIKADRENPVYDTTYDTAPDGRRLYPGR